MGGFESLLRHRRKPRYCGVARSGSAVLAERARTRSATNAGWTTQEVGKAAFVLRRRASDPAPIMLPAVLAVMLFRYDEDAHVHHVRP